jgi:hypothetical protein
VLPRLLLRPAVRAAALLVAVGLSGIPQLAEALAPVPAHRCACHGHGPGEACSCRLCILKARRADGKLPPCHRLAARKAEAADEAQRRAGPCLSGTCAPAPDGRLATEGVAPFDLPPAPRRGAMARGWVPPHDAAALPGPTRRPELPPPRLV